MDKYNCIKKISAQIIKGLDNNYNTIIKRDKKAFSNSCDIIESRKTPYLFGVKNTDVIAENMDILAPLVEGGFVLHTYDAMSEKGRAVDASLLNPITLKPMTGSSSGSAINVFLGINDMAVGTDGGGSVLSPANSLNLYGFITKLIHIPEKYKKSSTDNISFTPSIGFISRELDVIKKAMENYIGAFSDIKGNNKNIIVAIPKEDTVFTPDGKDINIILKKYLSNIDFTDSIITIDIAEIDFPNVYDERKPCIDFLEKNIEKYDLILSYEGPIDYFGLGDSIFGHYNDLSRSIQSKSGKGLSRVVNMVGLSAIICPDPENNFSSGVLIISKSEKVAVKNMFGLAEKIQKPEKDELINRYFYI